MHIAQIGTGRVGRPTAYSIMCAKLADTLTVCDVKPGLAAAFAEELQHVTASVGLDIEINACESDEDVAGADIILISAGKPRIPGVKMSRRDLAIQNAKIVKYVAETTSPRNPAARYVVITNPVDAMAMICKKYSKAEFVISTGTNLESLRFKSQLAKTLGVSVSKIQGFVGGEHGEGAIALWSTVKINGIPLDRYLKAKNQMLNKAEIDSYMKTVAKRIVDNIGGTEYGPAASFRDIVRAIAKNTNEIFAVAIPIKFEAVVDPVFVSVPLYLGSSIGSSMYKILSDKEKEGVAEAALSIHKTYQTAVEAIE